MTADARPAAPSAKETWQAQAARYALLFDVVLLIARSRNLDEVLTQAVNKIKWAIDFDRCTLGLCNEDRTSHRLRTLLDTRRGADLTNADAVPDTEGVLGLAIRDGQPRLLHDRKRMGDPNDPTLGHGAMDSVLAVPLQAYGQVLGAVAFAAVRPGLFGDEDVKVAVQLATHLGLAIDRWQKTAALEREIEVRERAEAEIARRMAETHAAHGEAEAARNRLSEAIEAVSEGFALYDPDDRLVVFNSKYREYFFDAGTQVAAGATFEHLIRAVAEAGMIDFGGLDKDAWLVARLSAHKNPSGPREIRLSNGRWLKTSERRTADGGLVGVYTDITELKQRETQLGDLVDNLARARDEAMEATRTKSQFLANMSHELRTPLNAVIGIAEMLHEDAEDLGQTDFIEPLQRINRAGKHLLNLINDILDLSKIEAGKVELSIENFDVAPLVAEIANMARPLAERNGNALIVDCAGDAGTMHSDPTRVRQVAFNLLSNACKFTEKGKVSFIIRRRAQAPVEHIEITVTDTGIGISDAQMSRLFKEFSQADASTTRKYGGTGLGLTISQRLCRLMGGEIAVESAPGAGTTFTVTLPAIVPAPGTDAAPQPAAADGAPGAQAGNVVLVVDDEPFVHDLMRRHIGRGGIEIVTATSGAEALQRARETRPAVITLDVLMPDMDGWEVLRRLKSDPQLAPIPVVMVTILDDKNKGYALGAADFVTKPVTREVLRRALSRYVAQSAGAHVLVVEDDAPTREMLRRLLVGEGCIVGEAANGRAGLEALAGTRCDLILLDLVMPEMDGFEFLDALRADESLADIPVIVVTAADLDANDRARLTGCVAKILSKSQLGHEALLAEVRRLVGDALEANARPVGEAP